MYAHYMGLFLVWCRTVSIRRLRLVGMSPDGFGGFVGTMADWDLALTDCKAHMPPKWTRVTRIADVWLAVRIVSRHDGDYAKTCDGRMLAAHCTSAFILLSGRRRSCTTYARG